MNFVWDKDTWKDYIDLQYADKKSVKKINELLLSIQKDGVMHGLGKPEQLKYNGRYSRRIDKQNRLVYEMHDNGDIVILACRGHYEK